MEIKELRKTFKLTQRELSSLTNIPKRTIEDWESGRRNPAPYMFELIKCKIEKEIGHP